MCVCVSPLPWLYCYPLPHLAAGLADLREVVDTYRPHVLTGHVWDYVRGPNMGVRATVRL